MGYFSKKITLISHHAFTSVLGHSFLHLSMYMCGYKKDPEGLLEHLIAHYKKTILYLAQICLHYSSKRLHKEKITSFLLLEGLFFGYHFIAVVKTPLK